MAPGTFGFRLSGRITREEYFQILDPIKEQLERGEKVSFLVDAGADFHGLDLGALWEDVKVAGSVGLKYRSSWERLALVTDNLDEAMRHIERHAVERFGLQRRPHRKALVRWFDILRQALTARFKVDAVSAFRRT